jgi:hypothetical protein
MTIGQEKTPGVLIGGSYIGVRVSGWKRGSNNKKIDLERYYAIPSESPRFLHPRAVKSRDREDFWDFRAGKRGDGPEPAAPLVVRAFSRLTRRSGPQKIKRTPSRARRG